MWDEGAFFVAVKFPPISILQKKKETEAQPTISFCLM
jgi:hypothetical protein